MATLLNNDSQGRSFRLPHITLLSLLVEITIIVVMGLAVNQQFMNMNPDLRLIGNESEYLMASSYTMHDVLHEQGYIPLWQPWMEYGEPLVNNPFGFLFNPVSSIPSLLIGTVNGIKISIILSVIVAGLGGWVLGRVLGLRALARVMLGLLMIGKGQMHAMLVPGFFQLSVAQAYFPWVMAGAVAILWYRRRRWPIVLTALSIALLFWAGLMWYLLPFALILGTLFVFHLFRLQASASDDSSWFKRRLVIDLLAARRMIVAGVLTVMLCSVTLLPLWFNQQYLGQTSIIADDKVDIGLIVELYFSGDAMTHYSTFGNGRLWHYFSYTMPGWFAIAVAGLCIVLWLWRRPLPVAPNLWRLVLASGFLLIFCTYWAAGQNPVIEWAYTAVPLVSQFRHVQRVLGVSTFLLAMLGAIALDIAWVAITTNIALRDVKAGLWRTVRTVAAGGLIVASAVASWQVLSVYNILGEGGLIAEDVYEDQCVQWLRNTFPDEPLTVWTVNYRTIFSYVRNEVRHARIATDFYRAQGLRSEVGPENLIDLSVPRWAIVFEDGERVWARDVGFQPYADSPISRNNNMPCVMENPNALSYMYMAPQGAFEDWQRENKVNPSQTTPVSTFYRNYDRIAVIATNSSDQVQYLTAQEVNFPGWTAEMDGKPVPVVSVGRQIGVALPPDGQPHRILFAYRPTLLFTGAAITLLAIFLLIAYLLRLDRLIPAQWGVATRRAASRVSQVMTDPTILAAKDDPDFAPVIPPSRQLSAPKAAAPDAVDIVDAEVVVLPPEPADGETGPKTGNT